MKDKGLFLVALLLIVLGAGVLASGEAGISWGYYFDTTPLKGNAANMVGVALIISGIYLIFQAKK